MNNGTIVLSSEAASKITDDAVVSIKIADQPQIPKEVAAKIRSSSVYDITISTAAGNISEFGGNLTVSLKYNLREGENAEDVYIIYIKDDSTYSTIDATYADGYVTFTIDHLSLYAVAFEESGSSSYFAFLGAFIAAMVVLAVAVVSWKYSRDE